MIKYPIILNKSLVWGKLLLTYFLPTTCFHASSSLKWMNTSYNDLYLVFELILM